MFSFLTNNEIQAKKVISHELINLIENLRETEYTECIGRGIFVDLPKVCHTVDYDVTMAIINHQGVSSNWYVSYLPDCKKKELTNLEMVLTTVLLLLTET